MAAARYVAVLNTRYREEINHALNFGIKVLGSLEPFPNFNAATYRVTIVTSQFRRCAYRAGGIRDAT
jgi:hypothetical protein